MLTELELLARFILRAVVGFERVDKPARLRTHILVFLGSAQFTILSFYAFPGSDPVRIAAYVVADIGFYLAAIVVTAITYATLRLAWPEKKTTSE